MRRTFSSELASITRGNEISTTEEVRGDETASGGLRDVSPRWIDARSRGLLIFAWRLPRRSPAPCRRRQGFWIFVHRRVFGESSGFSQGDGDSTGSISATQSPGRFPLAAHDGACYSAAKCCGGLHSRGCPGGPVGRAVDFRAPANLPADVRERTGNRSWGLPRAFGRTVPLPEFSQVFARGVDRDD